MRVVSGSGSFRSYLIAERDELGPNRRVNFTSKRRWSNEPAHLVLFQNIPDFLPLDVLLLGRVSAFPQKLAENGSIVIAFGGGYIAITFRCHREEVHESVCGHGPNPGCFDERHIRSEVMVHRKLDKVPGEMCAATDEDLGFGICVELETVFSCCARGRCVGCSGRVASDVERER